MLIMLWSYQGPPLFKSITRKTYRMRHINGLYTHRYNCKHSFDGQLFRGRYKAIVVDEDNYFLELIRYIHQNPVCSKQAEKAEHYEWSSRKGYLSKTKKWNWLYKDFILTGIFSTSFSL